REAHEYLGRHDAVDALEHPLDLAREALDESSALLGRARNERRGVGCEPGDGPVGKRVFLEDLKRGAVVGFVAAQRELLALAASASVALDRDLEASRAQNYRAPLRLRRLEAGHERALATSGRAEREPEKRRGGMETA